MCANFLFESAEVAIDSVGGIWNIELGVSLIGEKKRKIPFEAFVRTVYILVRVIPVLRSLNIRLLSIETVPALLPCSESLGECLLVSFRQRECQVTQFHSGFCFWSSG